MKLFLALIAILLCLGSCDSLPTNSSEDWNQNHLNTIIQKVKTNGNRDEETTIVHFNPDEKIWIKECPDKGTELSYVSNELTFQIYTYAKKGSDGNEFNRTKFVTLNANETTEAISNIEKKLEQLSGLSLEPCSDLDGDASRLGLLLKELINDVQRKVELQDQSESSNPSYSGEKGYVSIIDLRVEKGCYSIQTNLFGNKQFTSIDYDLRFPAKYATFNKEVLTSNHIAQFRTVMNKIE